MLLDHLEYLAQLYALGRFERGKGYPLSRLVQDAERTVIGADEAYRPLHHALGNLLKIRMRVQRIGDLEQGVGPACFLLLRDIEAGVLITDGELAGDGFEKRDLFVQPNAGPP